jgi:hypothetical protein
VDIVLDCDIVSTLAKIDRIGLLAEIFKDDRIVIARNRNGVFLTNDRLKRKIDYFNI